VLATALILKAARPVVAVPVTDIPSGRALSVATIAGRRHAAVTALSDALVHATRTGHPG
jgi:hypothetical protein